LQHIDVGFGDDDDERELSRVAILSFLAGRWHTACCLVDGEGMAVDLLWKRSFDGRDGSGGGVRSRCMSGDRALEFKGAAQAASFPFFVDQRGKSGWNWREAEKGQGKAR
jgi:hypothetical protein